MGIGSIPNSKIEQWAERWKLSPAHSDVLLYVIRGLDVRYLKKMSEKVSEKRDKSVSKGTQ